MDDTFGGKDFFVVSVTNQMRAERCRFHALQFGHLSAMHQQDGRTGLCFLEELIEARLRFTESNCFHLTTLYAKSFDASGTTAVLYGSVNLKNTLPLVALMGIVIAFVI